MGALVSTHEHDWYAYDSDADVIRWACRETTCKAERITDQPRLVDADKLIARLEVERDSRFRGQAYTAMNLAITIVREEIEAQ